jgi:hypothetical protein
MSNTGLFKVDYFFPESGDHGAAFFRSEKDAERFRVMLESSTNATAVLIDCEEDKEGGGKCED